MPDDELRWRRVPPLVRRLASPAGLIMAGLCLLLPFMSGSCASDAAPRAQLAVTYTGVDVIAGGRPAVSYTDDADRAPIRTLDDAEVIQLIGEPPAALPPQPLAWLAAALMAATLAVAALPSRTWRTTFTAGLALAAGIVLWGATALARRDAADAAQTLVIRVASASSADPKTVVPHVRESADYPLILSKFHYSYGLWITIAALAAVGVANTVRAGRDPDAPRS